MRIDVFSQIEKRFDKKSIISILALLLLSLILTFSIEFVHRLNIVDISLSTTFSETFEWAKTNNIHFWFNYFIVLSIMSLFSSLIGCVYIGFSLSGMLLIFLTIVNNYKILFRGDPLFPWDLMLRNESSNMLQYVTNRSDIIRLGIIFGFLIVFALLRFILPKLSFKIKYRAIIFILATLLIYSFVLKHSFLGIKIYRLNHIANRKWEQEQSYLENGFVLAFSLNVKDVIISAHKNYNKEYIKKIAENEILGYDIPVSKTAKKQPNLIIIMNEAFWDPTVLENVKFSEDPIPFFRRLHEESTSGWLKSPEFGGGTSNIEFEVMTGNSLLFLPSGSMAFQQYLGKPVMSLASILRNQGYKSIGIHSYYGWFWNRIESYKNLGFDKFISLEYFTDLRYQGWHISDEVVTDMIIDKLEENEKPLFIYAVTMQNHGPYNSERYDRNTIQVEGDLSDESKLILETFTQGLVDADKSLEKLINYLEISQEPTIVVFYGDHLPMLGQRYSVYTESGYIEHSDASTWSYEEALKMREVPVVIWSNYNRTREDIGTINTSFLGPYLLQYMNKEMPEYFKYLLRLSSTTPVLDRNYAKTPSGELLRSDDELLKRNLNNYEILQYDQLFGKNYLDKANEGKWILAHNPDYNREINDIKISNVIIERNRLIIKGDKFVPNVYVTVNGRNTNFKYKNPTTIELNLQEANLNTNGQNKIQVGLINSKGILLTKSNEYIID